MPTPPLPILLQKENSITLTVYDEASNTLTNQTLPPEYPPNTPAEANTDQDKSNKEAEEGDFFTGDYSECTIHFNPLAPASFAHVSTSMLYYSTIFRRPLSSPHPTEGSATLSPLASVYGIRNVFQYPMPHVVRDILFSPKGNYLVTYSLMDVKRHGDGNVCIFHVPTGTLCLRVRQGVWPAMRWTADEMYLVRHTLDGQLHVLSGDIRQLCEPPGSEEKETKEASSFSGSAPPSSPQNSVEDDNAAPKENDVGGTSTPSPTTSSASSSSSSVVPRAMGKVLNCMMLMLAKDKEIEFQCSPSERHPFLALFKPFEDDRPASFAVFRLPQMREMKDAFMQMSFGRAEAATMLWSPSGNYIALLVKQATSGAASSHSSTTPSNTNRNSGGWGTSPLPTSLASNTNNSTYYGKLSLRIVDIRKRTVQEVKLKSVCGGSGASSAAAANLDVVHDCCWRPSVREGKHHDEDELLVIHGNMPRNRATLVSAAGVPLLTFGEGPRNMVRWSPNGEDILVGGSGNLAGDYQCYCCRSTTATTEGGAASEKLKATTPSSPSSRATCAKQAAPPAALTALSNAGEYKCVGEINEKCSMESWAPDSYHIMFSTIFTRLRVDNKVVIAKKNGVKRLTQKFKALYGAHWIPVASVEEAEEGGTPSPKEKHENRSGVAARPGYPAYRAASPRPLEAEVPKPQVYRPPGAASGSRPAATTTAGGVAASAQTATTVKPVGLIGGKLAPAKKKKKRR